MFSNFLTNTFDKINELSEEFAITDLLNEVPKKQKNKKKAFTYEQLTDETYEFDPMILSISNSYQDFKNNCDKCLFELYEYYLLKSAIDFYHSDENLIDE